MGICLLNGQLGWLLALGQNSLDMPPSYFALGQKVNQVGHLNALWGQGLVASDQALLSGATKKASVG